MGGAALLLKELLSAIDVIAISGPQDIEVAGITYDSRKVQPGYLFVAIKGFKVDGHSFINNAREAGATAVVVEREVEVPADLTVIKVSDSRQALALLADKFYGHPSRKMTVVGVTGTNGKTTTTHLIAAIWRQVGLKPGVVGTIHNLIGEKALPVTNTTPESLDLHKLMAEMVREDVQGVAMEVSSHALALNRVAGVKYDVAVFTNITQDHLDFHGNMEDYLAAKAKLFEKDIKYAVINADDQAAEQLFKISRGKVYTYGIENNADVRAKDIQVTARGVSFTVNGPWGEQRLELKLTGRFNVYNSLAAYTVGMVLGYNGMDVKAALEGVTGVAGRFELVDQGQDFAVVVDYAHTPDGLENILTTARQITKGRLITVFGCGGDRDRTKRPIMGEIAARYSDLPVVTSDNPRTEDPQKIIEDILVGLQGKDPGSYLVIADRREAINRAINLAEPGDVVVIAGKGHEDYQIIGTTKYHFDDREVAAEALKARGFNK
ncbi:UDP-N-acetylmuramoyl-L-alanyl-D-glutamate--2,6-diaminopimelate ligase [Desulfotomaculum nigrificans CO-1-SRB]|uniref:UDP-N-acetylmuramoyl-L-alanyl-D-glutamate--2,6-diaminopimelate ligase n=1 Tax=Desulfotomaculum nigrificans (strain DSM 14880 / VKM B-2319 / CO-1-SRB) TaxID=868595 RepID=F6B3F1_DESCC|nr:UDP-N-acetylmuramoyl-L-alanyl-D-glutamate--2,6-diaminopimelate ligase [Desulfotomaculum nigrificans]AEF95182.1 UDP-N-acetylmuramoyl-L-alanyl-D-glutamate--2,6-diaminopimelate ligase [Desulfotomaculum nigrificans CO-1-SRB]